MAMRVKRECVKVLMSLTENVSALFMAMRAACECGEVGGNRSLR